MADAIRRRRSEGTRDARHQRQAPKPWRARHPEPIISEAGASRHDATAFYIALLEREFYGFPLESRLRG